MYIQSTLLSQNIDPVSLEGFYSVITEANPQAAETCS